MSFVYTKPEPRLGNIETPIPVANFLYRITKHLRPKIVLDPCAGRGNLLIPWSKVTQTFAVERDPYRAAECRGIGIPTTCSAFENLEPWPQRPDLVVCNPPWNAHWQKGKSYPEIFLRLIVERFGNQVPIIFLCPMGFLLNQRRKSKRLAWLKSAEAPTITSVISAPIDLYADTQFHSMGILFNIKRVKSHYFMEF